MGKKKEVLGMLEVKYMFQSSLIIFMIISSLALLTFYMNHHHQEMMSPTTTATIVLNYHQQQEDIVLDKKNEEEDGVVLEKKNEEKDSSFEEKNGEEDIRIEKKNEEEDSGIEKKNEEEEEKKDEEEEKKDEEEDIAIEKKKKEEEEEEDMAFEKKNEEEEVVIRKVYDTLKYDSLEGCDLFSGKWVLDNESYPLYKDGECPYVYGDFACGLYGRKDNKYQQWRWQPHGCTLPRFDAKEVLERLKGKRIIFVGDSVNRNQWISMVCMLQSAIPSGLKKMEKVPNVSLLTFKAIEYNVSIDFYWAPLLVESNGDHPTKHRTYDRIVRIKSIESHAKNWIDADALIFNSYLWWRLPTVKIINGSFEDPAQDYNIVNNRRGYRMGLKTWSNWLHKNINHTRTQTYFMSMTATHHKGVEWGKKDGENCLGETEPITQEGFWESGSDLRMLRVLEYTLNKLKAKGGNVQMLNVTQLTQYRKDAHPSIHRLHYSPLTKEQLSDPKSYADCTHWCLPGSPDVWNELVLAYILRGHKQQDIVFEKKDHEEDIVFEKKDQEKDNALEKKNEVEDTTFDKKNEEEDNGIEKKKEVREDSGFEKKNEEENNGYEKKKEEEEEKKEEEEDLAFEKKNEEKKIVRKEIDTSKYDSLEGCDLFSGKWVFDNKNYPLYKDGECPYVYADYNCGLYGRKDNKYQQWRWQPHGCDLPRFDAEYVLERLRGKRMIFVGDSVTKNQYYSMICMLQSVIPPTQKRREGMLHVPSIITFKAIEYDISIDFYWAPLLVESNADHGVKLRTKDRRVRLETIENHAKHWVDADVLVFNSYLWWRLPIVKILNGSFEDPKQDYNEVDNRRGYRMGLKAWSNWLHKNINHTRTQIHFMSMTATHHKGPEWGKKRDENCFGETEPITKEGFWESGSDSRMLRILEYTINKLKAKETNVHMVNITQLTQYRKDAHPSIYRLQHSPIPKEKRSNPKSYSDCTHWCLPGAPDVWNELLLASILRGHKQQDITVQKNNHEEDNVIVKNTQEKDNAFEKKNEEEDSGSTEKNGEQGKKNAKEDSSFEKKNEEGKKDEEDDIAFEKKNEEEEIIKQKYDTSKYDSLKGCDMFSGKWVLDDKTYPLYKDGECPYMYGDFACGMYGRKDKKFQQWRWKPHGCDIPRFDAIEILERLRGKRIILIGDSVMRNQWISMLCMFQSVIPPALRTLHKIPNASLLNFKAIEYNVSFDFYWAPLLVESNADHPKKHRILDRIVRLNSVEHHAKYWVDADALVFNSYLWWKLPTMKILNGSFEDPTLHYKIVDRRTAYRMGLKAWSNWMQKNINHTRTQIYYMSMTATHHNGREWGKHDGNCYGETEPITKEGFWESGSDQGMLRILEYTLNKLKAKGGNVQMMKISQLTQYRKDAHPGINRLFYSPLTKNQLSDPKSYADCSHWCLPGAPDVWNELLLAHVLRGHK